MRRHWLESALGRATAKMPSGVRKAFTNGPSVAPFVHRETNPWSASTLSEMNSAAEPGDAAEATSPDLPVAPETLRRSWPWQAPIAPARTRPREKPPPIRYEFDPPFSFPPRFDGAPVSTPPGRRGASPRGPLPARRTGPGP